MTPQELIKEVDKHVGVLMEYFDCVQILASHVTPEGTGRVFSGRGNWFARQGMAHEFTKQDEAQLNASELQKVIHPEGHER